MYFFSAIHEKQPDALISRAGAMAADESVDLTCTGSGTTVC